MNNEPIRILHYIKHLDSGGGETLVYNIYKNIDRTKIQFDFLVNQREKEKLNNKIEALGGKIIPLIEYEPLSTIVKIFRCVKSLYRFLKDNEYKIIHIHCSNGQGLLYSWIAKKAGVPIRIVHIHNTEVEGKFKLAKLLFHKMCRTLFMNAPTDYFACSEMAARWLFSNEIIKNKKYNILKNGIEIEKYIFDQSKRNIYRSKLGWENKKILINIGRMEVQKNQKFLVNIFDKIIASDRDYRLLIIGKGSLEKQILDEIEKLHLGKYIKVIGYTDEIEKYLWAGDIFILPSLSEGLGIVAIEAQAAGLPTIVSDTVPKEAFVTNLICSVSLQDDEDVWVNSLLNISINGTRKTEVECLKNKGFDIVDSSSILQKYYLEKVN